MLRDLLLRMRHSKARGVVMFVDEDNLRRFLSILKRMILRDHPELKNHFWFVASDSWGMKTSVIKGFEGRHLYCKHEHHSLIHFRYCEWCNHDSAKSAIPKGFQ